MKKFGSFLIPVVFILFFALVTPRILSGAISRSSMLIMVAVMFVLLLVTRPKKASTKTSTEVAAEVLDDFCAEAFQQNEALMTKFQAALKDIGGNMPKAAVAKLEKLASQCVSQADQYAVAMATALAFRKQNDLKNAIREYNKALVIHPTGKLAHTIGECYQRQGYLDKASDSYEFAQELEPENPQYPSSLGTVSVADGNYYAAMDYAREALELDPGFSQALATMAICAGVQGDSETHEQYLKLAKESGYSEGKILDTIKALKKRK